MTRLASKMCAFIALLASPNVEATRPLEALEAFELESLHYVANETSDAGLVAIVKDPAGVLHRLVPGNHLGRHDGRVTKVTEAELLLTELIEIDKGTWHERPTALPFTPDADEEAE